ncbi:MAG: sigma-70 family RNA polymerase sigma factor [Actinomycetota bacterium]|nr:sigma-70 family RNA polymerase sigma factor [Actinomycetota bacterium]
MSRTLSVRPLEACGPDRDQSCDRLSPEQLCARYADRVYRFAAMVSRDLDDAQDLAQDALERAIRGLPKFDPSRGLLEAWLWRIVVNSAHDRGRAAKRRQMLMERIIALTPGQAALDPEAPEGLTDSDLIQAVRSLRPRQRAVLALRFGADLDYATLAKTLGISPTAARVATCRALATLRSRLASADKEVI